MNRKGPFSSVKVPDDRKIADLWIAPFGWAAVTASIDTGVTEELSQSPKSAAGVAKILLLHPESVESVLRVLVAMGFARQSKNLFRLTEDAKAYLVPSSPLARMAELAKHFTTWEHKFLVRKLREQEQILRTFGDTWRNNAEENEAVKEAASGMDSIIKAPSLAGVRSGAFKGIEHLLDVGGGSGAFAAILTEHQPKTRVTILDLPAMCAQAKNWIQSRQAVNIDFHPADFFKNEWKTGCDAIYFSNVLHDWPEQDVLNLFMQARQNVLHQKNKPGRIFVLKVLRQENRNGPLMATIFHMQMQMGFGGAQYTMSDFKRLFKKARFSPPRVVAQFGYYSLLKAHAI